MKAASFFAVRNTGMTKGGGRMNRKITAIDYKHG